MDTHKYLPTKEGGFVRRAVSNMTANEKVFVAQTADCDCCNEADRLRAQRLARELLFNQSQVPPGTSLK